MSHYSPSLTAPYLCSRCGRHWGFHRTSDEACPVRVESADYSECAAQRGFTCVLGTSCDRTPVCARPGCAARDECHSEVRKP
jgi:hypothetical protein